MKLDNINRVFLLGIGGIGMSALARYFSLQSKRIYGYDKTSTDLTKKLVEEGFQILYTDLPEKIPEEIINSKTLFIYTPAVPKDNKIFSFIVSKGYQWYKRSDVLGKLSESFECIAIAGTHGKTTISGMTAHILFNSKAGCNAFVGGILVNYQSNLLTHKNSSFMVTEADEYDQSFLKLHPDSILISSVDPDHLDIYHSFSNLQNTFLSFANRLKKNKRLIIHHKLKSLFNNNSYLSYAIDQTNADFYAENIRLLNGKYIFDIITPKARIPDVELGIPGWINIENALGASALSYIHGADLAEIKNGLSTFRGIKRRLEAILINNKIVYFDDYAHHPIEIDAAISSIKKMYPQRQLTVVFQPHLYSRTRDLAAEFGRSLQAADVIILLDIYPAREPKIKGISSNLILSNINNRNKTIVERKALLSLLKKQSPELLLTLGAGDIDQFVEPIKEQFTQ
jgi:UDP-N-acetylmuramate--alanine ligase